MRILRTLGALGAAAALAISPALAQKSDVLVMNQAEVITKSKAGQSIQTQLKTIGQAAQAQLQSEGQQIQTEGQQLQQTAESLSKEDLQKRAQALAVKQQGVQRLAQIRQAEVAQAEAAALSELSEALEPVLRKIMKKRKAKMVLRRTDVAVMDDAVDITDEVIAELDKTLTTVKVTKPDLLAQAQANAAAAQ